MLISAAIIVKNEEDIIQRCLDCVSLFADEIVVVDTGSDDKTKEIAARHPKVKLFDSEHFGTWTHFSEFSFSVAKNEAVEKCSGTWVIWWDADDFIDEDNARKIRNLADTTEETCLYSFNIKYGPMSFEHCRMFRNGHNIKFDEAHSVHEYLNTLGHPNYSRHEVVIQHIPGNKHMPSGERNIAIMEKDYNERGMDDPRTLFYLANGYREAGRQDDAIEFYKKYLNKSQWGEERFFARYYLAQALVHKSRFAEARQEALRAVTEDFRFAETYCMLGDLAFREGDIKRAQLWFMMASETPYPSDAKLFVTPALYKEYPMARIKECHQKLVGEEDSLEERVKKIVEDPQTSVEHTTDTKEVLGSFSLPADSGEALTAASVLSAIAQVKGKMFKISVNEETKSLIEKLDGLSGADGDTVSLILPSKLNGRPREEWYSRAAGHVFSDWSSIVTKAKRIAEKAGV